MTTRLRRIPEARFKPWQYTDFYEVHTFLGMFVVSMATAGHIDRCLEAYSDLEWIDFHDLSGTPRRIQARFIARITAHA
jgi:hypothetical protein